MAIQDRPNETTTNPVVHLHPERNPGTALTLEWFETAQVNLSATQRRANTLGTRRSVKKEYQAAWLLKVISCMDLTTLAGDDTPGRVQRLAAKARQPVRQDILDALGVADLGLTVAAVCVYPTMVKHAVKALEGSGIPVASVATGFPAGARGCDRRARQRTRRRRRARRSPAAAGSGRCSGAPTGTRGRFRKRG